MNLGRTGNKIFVGLPTVLHSQNSFFIFRIFIIYTLPRKLRSLSRAQKLWSVHDYMLKENPSAPASTWGLGQLYTTTGLLPNQVLKTKKTQHRASSGSSVSSWHPVRYSHLFVLSLPWTPANEDRIFTVHSQLEAVASKVKFKYLILLKLLLHIVANSAETQILNRYESWLIWLLTCTLVIYVTQKQVILLLNSLRNKKEKNLQCILVL